MAAADIGIIVNGKARARYETDFQRLLQILKDHGRGFELAHTADARDIALETARFLERKVPYILVLGGDGTFSLAVQACMREGRNAFPDSALVPLPFGTGNDFFKGFIPKADQRDLAWLGQTLHRSSLSLGRVRDADGGTRYFTNSFSIGITPSILRHYERSGLRSYLFSTLKALPLYRAMGLKVNGRTQDTLLFMICKGPYAGGGMRLHAEAGHDKPQILWVPRISLVKAFLHLPKLYRGLTAVPEVRSYPFDAVELESAEGEIAVEMDGEIYALASPLRVDLIAGALQVAGPR